MKNIITLATTLLLCSHITMAAPNAISARSPVTQKKEWLFHPVATSAVNLEVERIGSDIMLYLYSASMKDVSMIYVEKSKDPTGGFTHCKAVKVADHLAKSKNYIGVVDESPYANSVDSYYRIKTVNAAGETKVYPAVNLGPIFTIEDNETVDSK